MPDTTLVAFLLDRSGSMGAIKASTIESFNGYVASLKDGLTTALAGEIRFSLVQFDTFGLETTWKDAPIETVDGLTDQTYQPRGGTPLIDACMAMIEGVERKLAELTEKPKIVVCFQTDGHENASQKFTWSELNAKIKEKIAAGWQFLFMGASIDAYDQAGKMGIARGATVSYDSRRPEAAAAAFYASGMNTRGFAEGRRADTAYTAEQKAAAGDAFDPDAKPAAPAPPPARHASVTVDEIDL